jgi:hypothetical protein
MRSGVMRVSNVPPTSSLTHGWRFNRFRIDSDRFRNVQSLSAVYSPYKNSPPSSPPSPVPLNMPHGCDQIPSTPVTAARASSAPSAHPCPADLTMAKIEELDSTGFKLGRTQGLVGAQCRGCRRLEHAYKTHRLRVGREHVLCCKNDSELCRKLSLRRLSLR